MKRIEEVIAAFGRFTAGLAIGIALTSVYVVAAEAVAEAGPSAARMAVGSLRATAADAEEADRPGSAAPGRLHVYGRGAQRV